LEAFTPWEEGKILEKRRERMVCRGCGEQHVPGKQEKPTMIPDTSQAGRQHLASRPKPNRWNIRPCGCKLKLPVVS